MLYIFVHFLLKSHQMAVLKIETFKKEQRINKKNQNNLVSILKKRRKAGAAFARWHDKSCKKWLDWKGIDRDL